MSDFFDELDFDTLGDTDSEEASADIIRYVVYPEAGGPLGLFEWGANVAYLPAAKYMRLFHLGTALDCDYAEKEFIVTQNTEDVNPDGTPWGLVTSYNGSSGPHVGWLQPRDYALVKPYTFRLWIPYNSNSLDYLKNGELKDIYDQSGATDLIYHDMMFDLGVRGSSYNPAWHDGTNHLWWKDTNHYSWVLGHKRDGANILLVTGVRVNLEKDSSNEAQTDSNPESCGITIDFLKEHPTSDPNSGKVGNVTDVYTDIGMTTPYVSGGDVGLVLYAKCGAELAVNILVGQIVIIRDKSDSDNYRKLIVQSVTINGDNSVIQVMLGETDSSSVLAISNLEMLICGLPGKVTYLPKDKWPTLEFTLNTNDKPIQRGANTLFVDHAIPLPAGTHMVVRLKRPATWVPSSFRVIISGYELKYHLDTDDDDGDHEEGSLFLDGDVGRPAGASLEGGPFKFDEFEEGVVKAE